MLIISVLFIFCYSSDKKRKEIKAVQTAAKSIQRKGHKKLDGSMLVTFILEGYKTTYTL